jgi:predicted nucleic acid-binding protein
MAAPVYLADTSVYVLQGRYPAVHERFASLLAEGRLAACQMTALEYLNNAPDPKGYEVLWAALRGQRWIDTTTAAMERALEVHRMLGTRGQPTRGQHRHLALPDLIIAATAEEAGATVLHYDADYDKIADITGQPVEWVAARGSLASPRPPAGQRPGG